MKMYRAHLVFFMLLILANPASAVMISFSPSSNTVNVGETFDVEVLISDLFASDGSREVVSGFDLDVLFDPAVLNATGVEFGSLLGDLDPFVGETVTIFSLFSGLIDLFELSFLCYEEDLSDPLCSFEPFLINLQANPTFTLATLSFEALSVGSSLLTFDQGAVSGGIDVSGKDLTSLLVLDPIGQSTITVNAAVVSEPASILLLMAGLLGLTLVYRNPKKSINS